MRSANRDVVQSCQSGILAVTIATAGTDPSQPFYRMI
ncbi:hypothetical protein QFZ99_005073 [Paraburkholderia atlantica]|uniref:Uncharacterized protein n=1 Tax=Paraburkholderia atlantica TaxID=2654982 RepID=A0A7W8Q3J3_PARAM|nr:hypothetical protein [Paraburkholderia atlantica]